ncbi:MAG: DedA family protein [Gammaproteobacteria bacterium]|nr:DedA family protein [Gammaproteobacteria bacterium]MDH5802429.1 DedA family protein [Gammaproteobacteria bacterium]
MNFDAIQVLLAWMQAHPGLAGFAIFLIACTESLIIVGIVVPGVALMLGVGALVGLGALDLWPTLLWAMAGAITGDGISYWVGRHFDRQLRSVWPFTRHPELLPRGERFFHKHGALSIFIGRFVGPVRPVIPAIAGIMHMNPWVFTLVNVISAIAWAPVVVLPGVAVGASMHLASELAGRLMLLFLLVMLLFWGLFVLLRTIDKRLIAPWLARRFGGVDYKHMPGLLLKYLLESTFGVFVLTLVVGVMLAVGVRQELSLQLPIVEPEQWWDGQWRSYLVNRSQNEPDPFTIQLWGSEVQIQQALTQTDWREGERLSYKNALLWLSPSLQPERLPVFNQHFSTQIPRLMKVRQIGEVLWVLRLWPIVERPPEVAGLWLATISPMKLKSFYGFRLPLNYEWNSKKEQDLLISNPSWQWKMESAIVHGRILPILLIRFDPS